MFKNLSNLTSERNTQEALEFYIAYLSFFMIAVFIFNSLTWYVTRFVVAYATQQYLLFINILAIIYCCLLSFLIAKKKHILKEKSIIFLIILSGIFTFFNGLILGLVVATYLTLLPKKS